jgi:hypothetical protein
MDHPGSRALSKVVAASLFLVPGAWAGTPVAVTADLSGAPDFEKRLRADRHDAANSEAFIAGAAVEMLGGWLKMFSFVKDASPYGLQFVFYSDPPGVWPDADLKVRVRLKVPPGQPSADATAGVKSVDKQSYFISFADPATFLAGPFQELVRNRELVRLLGRVPIKTNALFHSLNGVEGIKTELHYDDLGLPWEGLDPAALFRVTWEEQGAPSQLCFASCWHESVAGPLVPENGARRCEQQGQRPRVVPPRWSEIYLIQLWATP